MNPTLASASPWLAIGALVATTGLATCTLDLHRQLRAQSSQLTVMHRDDAAAGDGAATLAVTDLRRSTDALAERLAEVEDALARYAARPAPSPPTAVAPSDPAADPVVAAPGAADTEAKQRLLSQLAVVTAPDFDWQAGAGALQEFFALARGSTVLDDHLRALEDTVETSPEDNDARMELATAYLGKLFTVQGPEQGLWGSRAEQQWNAVRAQAPEHWESRFRLGTNYAFYPDAMGKTGDAIALLTEAREIQERAPAARPEHAQTYATLARLHQREGHHEQARQTLREGLRFFPDDDTLRAALDRLR